MPSCAAAYTSAKAALVAELNAIHAEHAHVVGNSTLLPYVHVDDIMASAVGESRRAAARAPQTAQPNVANAVNDELMGKSPEARASPWRATVG